MLILHDIERLARGAIICRHTSRLRLRTAAPDPVALDTAAPDSVAPDSAAPDTVAALHNQTLIKTLGSIKSYQQYALDNWIFSQMFAIYLFHQV